MESYISFSIISVFFYTFMILTLLAGKRSRIINSFMCVLGGMLCWTLGSFLMRMEAGPSYILWYYVSLAGILFLPYFYYVFISEFMGVRMGRKSKIPLLLMLLLFAINIPGGIILRWPDLIRKTVVRILFIRSHPGSFCSLWWQESPLFRSLSPCTADAGDIPDTANRSNRSLWGY